MYRSRCPITLKQLSSIVLCIYLGCGRMPLHAHTTKKIETPHFSLGFDAKLANLAQRIANTLETIYLPISKTLGSYPSPIYVWFDTKTTDANGHFTISPRHISLQTFYASDPYFIGNLDWLSYLCLHEFRHAVQHRTQYCNIPLLLKPIYVLMNMIPYVGVPRFFNEGDAVCIETVFSKSGRGRFPERDKWYKIHLLEQKPISFSQLLFGSVKNRKINYYCSGYYLVAHIRRKYGAEAIKKIYEKSIRIPYIGFYNAIRSVTKKSLLKVYREMNQELLLGWQKQLEGLPITPVTQLTIKKPADDFDYINPFMDASGNILAFKSGKHIRDQLVLLTPYAVCPAVATLQEKRLLYLLSSPHPETFAIGETCAAWLEQYRHPWKVSLETQGSDPSKYYRTRLQYYDLKKRKRRTLIRNCRYNALTISPDGRQLVAVELAKDGQQQLVILDTKEGKVIKKLAHPEGGSYLTPSWHGTTHIVVTRTKDQQNSIIEIEIATGTIETLLPTTNEHRSFPKIYKDYLLYNSSYNGIDNIYAMHLPTKAYFQVTSRKYGAYLGMVDPLRNQLIFTDCAKDGRNIVAMPFDPLLWIPLEKIADKSLHYYAPLVAQEGNNEELLSTVPNHLYALKPYRFVDGIGINGMECSHQQLIKLIPVEYLRLQNNFKLSPYFHCNIFTVDPIKNFFLKDYVLKDYIKNNIPQKGAPIASAGIKVCYQTCYPILQLDLGYRWYKKPTELDGKRLEFGMRFPYYFSLEDSYGNMSLETNAIVRPSQKEKKGDWSLAYKFHVNHSTTKSSQDILHAPWSQQLDIEFKHRLTAPTIHLYTHKFRINSQFYFPGMGKHHYLGVGGDYTRKQQPKSTIMVTFKSRKISNSIIIDRTPLQHSMEPTLRYGFPLCYPEGGLPLLLFIKQVNIEGYIQGHFEKTTLEEERNLIEDKWLKWLKTVGIKVIIVNNLLTQVDPTYSLVLNFGLQQDYNKKEFLSTNWEDWKYQFGMNVSLNI